MKWASVLTGNRLDRVSLADQIRDQGAKAHDLARMAHGPARRCGWTAYAADSEDTAVVDGNRATFEEDMRNHGMSDEGIRAELEAWDSFPSPVAILHVAIGAAPSRDRLN